MTLPFAFGRKNNRKNLRFARAARWFRPILESLEDRVVPAAPSPLPGQGLVTGTVFRDLDSDGVRGSTENGLEFRTVYVDADHNRQNDPGEASTAANANGVYVLNLDPGRYSIRVVPIPGLSEFGSSPIGGGHDVTVSAGVAMVDRDFGSLFLNPAAPLPQAIAHFPNVSSDNERYIHDLYRKILGRNADPAGLLHWVSQLTGGDRGADEEAMAAREAVAERIWDSAEHRGFQVEEYYVTLLNRSSDAAGKTHWVNAMLSGANEVEVVQGFLASPEYQGSNSSDTAFATALYRDLLGRAPDPDGLAHWQQLMQAGASRGVIVDLILFSTESLRNLVNSYYAAFLNRPADPGGAAYWVAVLQQRAQGLHKVGARVLSADETFQAGHGVVLGSPQPGPIVVNSTADEVNQGGGVITLRDAINLANTSPGPDTIVLQKGQTYDLNQVDNYWYGANGLPAIASEITIQGNGATIHRSGGPNFRFFYVSNQQYGGLPTGNLTLQGLTLRGGVAKGGDSYYGGGGLGAGGAIFNQGTLALDGVLLRDNTAQGGSSGWYTDYATMGGGIGQDAQTTPKVAPGGFGGSVPFGNFPNLKPTNEGQGGSSNTLAGFGGGGVKNSIIGDGGSGQGGFGGGGGNHYGVGGFGGGDGGDQYWAGGYGGGGAGMGGAVFNRGGTVSIVNSTLTSNHAVGGDAPGYYSSGVGDALGGAVFNLNGSVQLVNNTIAGNDLKAYAGSGGEYYYGKTFGAQVFNIANSPFVGVTVKATLTLANTILSGAPADQFDAANVLFLNEVGNQATIENDPRVGTTKTNIISTDIANLTFNLKPGGPGVVNVGYLTNQDGSRVVDPKLLGLNDNQGYSQTMALKADSLARNAGSILAVSDPNGHDQRGPGYLRSFDGKVDIGAIEMQHLTPLGRLAEWNRDAQMFEPVAAHGIGASNSPTLASNVYVVSHGWMPGYIDWVDRAFNEGRVPLTWETWQGPVKPSAGASTPWLFEAGSTTDPQFLINDTGLAQEILKVDPNATVLAYSWIDESATEDALGFLPVHGYRSEAKTTMAGLQMAEGIVEALAPNYHAGLGKVHLMGHSHGSRVTTVAAVALQQAAKENAQYDVVRQLTLFDSPEDNQASIITNPVEIDAANFDWYYLAQLTQANRHAVAGTVVDSKTVNVSGPNTQFLFNGMGVTGPGVPAGTTITINASRTQVTLSAALTGAPAANAPIDLVFWDWSNHAIFVDSYVSHFGADYGNFTVNLPNKGGVSLNHVVDVDLTSDDVFHTGLRDIGLRHEYSANWYAGSVGRANSQPGLQRVGLFWSPLIAGASAPPPVSSPPVRSVQKWEPVKADKQFVLTQELGEKAVQPSFHAVTLYMDEDIQGNVVLQGPPSAVTGMTITAAPGNSVFTGALLPPDTGYDVVGGFSFDFTFGGAVADNIQLQIRVGAEGEEGDLYFALTSSVANSSVLPNGGTFTSTFGMTAEWRGGIGRFSTRTPPAPSDIQIALVRTDGLSGPVPATTVTVKNFHTFWLY